MGRAVNERWRIGSELGSGSGGVVFSVVSPEGRRGALKRAHPNNEARLERERGLLDRGLHPAFPALLDPGGSGWFVMELVSGYPAATLRPVPPGGVARIGAELFSALAALHAAGIVHRDVALRNLVVEPTGRVRLLDLGAAAEAGAEGLSVEGVVMGTRDRASAVESGPGLDLFAGGGLLLELLGTIAPGPVTTLAYALRDVSPDARPTAARAAAELGRWVDPCWAPTATAAATGGAVALDPPAPEGLGRYQIQGVLGRGGMGVVYRAWDPELHRAVALKAQISGDFRRFEREARAVAAIDHPGVVKILDTGHDDRTAWLALELVEGSNLEQRLAVGRVPTADAVRWIAEVAEGLAAAHVLKLVHRDVKPSNVLLDTSGRARLTDFGLARPIEVSAELTRDGILIGTPRYLSPEQAGGGAVDARSDVYSLGLVLFEVLVGRPAFSGPGLLLLANRATAPSPTVPPDVQPELRRVVKKAIALRPEDRYVDAGALGADLRRWQRGEPVRAQRVPLAREAALWASRNRRPLTAAILGAAGVLGFVAATGLATSLAAARARAAREEAAEVAWNRTALRLEELRVSSRHAEAVALFDASITDPLVAGTRTQALAWLAEAQRRGEALQFDDAVRAVGQAWLASTPDTSGDVLVAMGTVLADAGRWEERTRVADLLEREDPARAQAPDGRALVRDRDAWRRLPSAPGDDPLDRLVARLGHATRLQPWDGLDARFVQPPSLPGDPDDSWVVDGTSARRVRGPALVPDGQVMELAAFASSDGWVRGPGQASHPWWGGTRELRVGDERLRADDGHISWLASDATSRDADPWGNALGASAGPAAVLDVDGDGVNEIAVSRTGWGVQHTRVLDPVSGRTRALWPVGSGSMAVVRVGDRDWLAVAPAPFFRSAIQSPDRDPRTHRGIQVYDVARPERPQWSTDGSTHYAVDATDLDGDGRTDLVGGSDGATLVALQTADGGFRQTRLGGLSLDGHLDADGDGARDLVVTDEAGRRWLLGAGDDRVGPRAEPQVVSDPDPSIQAALDLDRIGLRRDAVERLDAVAVMAEGPVASRARMLAAERVFGVAGDQRFRAIARGLDGAGAELGELAIRAARAQARSHRLPEALDWASRATPSGLPEADDWRRLSTVPTLRWPLPGPVPPTYLSSPELVHTGPDGLSLDSAEEREVLRIPVRLVDPAVGFSLDATLDRLEWAGGWSASLETLDGRSLGALRVRGSGGGREVAAGLRCHLHWDAQERPLPERTPAPGSAGTFWWDRSEGVRQCGLDDRVQLSGRDDSSWPPLPAEAWWVLRTHSESGAPRTTLRVRALELRGMALREEPPRAEAPHPASAIAALDEAGRSDAAREALRAWWGSGTANAGFVRTRPHWLAWLDPADAGAALMSGWPQLYQHVGDPEIDSLLAALSRTAEPPAGDDRASYHATVAAALRGTDAARHHASIAWEAALALPDDRARHGALTLALPIVLEQDLARGDRALAREHLDTALRSSAWPELLTHELRATPALRSLL